MQLENSCCTSLMLLAGRVRLIAQHDVHRRELDQPDLESNEEIFQHKMQAYDKVVFTPPTPRGDTRGAGATVGVTHLREKTTVRFSS